MCSFNSLGFLPNKNWSICEIKQRPYGGTVFYHSYVTYAGGKVQQQSSRAQLAPPTPSLATWWAGKVFRLWNHWRFFDINWDPKISNGSFSKVTRLGFFAHLTFPGSLSGDIFFTNYQTKHFLLYFSLLLLSFEILFHGKIQNWRALFQTGIAWNFKFLLQMEDLHFLKDCIYSRLPFLQSERGQIILWLFALKCF